MSDSSQPQLRIFLVEDNDEWRQKTRLLLENNLGAEVTTERKGAHALRRLVQQERFDLLICDINLAPTADSGGVTDGWDVIKKAAEKSAVKGLIVLTGALSDPEAETAVKDPKGLFNLQGEAEELFPGKSRILHKRPGKNIEDHLAAWAVDGLDAATIEALITDEEAPNCFYQITSGKWLVRFDGGELHPLDDTEGMKGLSILLATPKKLWAWDELAAAAGDAPIEFERRDEEYEEDDELNRPQGETQPADESKDSRYRTEAAAELARLCRQYTLARLCDKYHNSSPADTEQSESNRAEIESICKLLGRSADPFLEDTPELERLLHQKTALEQQIEAICKQMGLTAKRYLDDSPELQRLLENGRVRWRNPREARAHRDPREDQKSREDDKGKLWARIKRVFTRDILKSKDKKLLEFFVPARTSQVDGVKQWFNAHNFRLEKTLYQYLGDAEWKTGASKKRSFSSS